MNPLVSVVVPTKNSSEFLEACLKSIKEQIYKNIELIVVDNFSTDATKEISEKYTNVFFEQGPERSAQRNFGAKHAKGEFVFFIDSDMELSKNVVGQCVSKMPDTKVGAIIIPEESFGEGFWAQCKKLERSFYVGVDWIEAARFFRKDLFEKIGGWDETITGGEDWDLSQRVRKVSQIDRIPAFIYHNEGHPTFFGMLKKRYYYGKGFKTYIKKRRADESKQTSAFARYKLFFSKPSKLFQNPLTGMSLLMLKTFEFFAIASGYVVASVS